MRHRVFGKKFSRTSQERKSLFRGLIRALIMNGEIITTESKAKSARLLAEKLVGRAKGGSFNDRRSLNNFIQSRLAVNHLVDKIAPLLKDNAGGITRLTRLFSRRGDRAMMARLEWIKKPPRAEIKVKEKVIKGEEIKPEKTRKPTRRRPSDSEGYGGQRRRKGNDNVFN